MRSTLALKALLSVAPNHWQMFKIPVMELCLKITALNLLPHFPQSNGLKVYSCISWPIWRHQLQLPDNGLNQSAVVCCTSFHCLSSKVSCLRILKCFQQIVFKYSVLKYKLRSYYITIMKTDTLDVTRQYHFHQINGVVTTFLETYILWSNKGKLWFSTKFVMESVQLAMKYNLTQKSQLTIFGINFVSVTKQWTYSQSVYL